VLDDRPFIEDGKLPVPEPSTVFVVSEVVGTGFTDHTTPREVTAEPPSEIIFPPPVAVLAVIPLISFVTGLANVSEGTPGSLLENLISQPNNIIVNTNIKTVNLFISPYD
jgi:hypothetical protein